MSQIEKIETFLTQIKSLDALSISIVEELKLTTVRNEALTVEMEKLKEELRMANAKIAELENSTEEVKPKVAKKKSAPKPTNQQTSTLF